MEMNRSGLGEYFVGLDIGTNSVGWAVTNPKYELLKCKGHKMWGSRLFEEGQVAESRRMARANRRRLARRRDRLHILEELFSDEISKVDTTFFLRLKESKYHFEDKTTKEKYVLFTDKDFNDKNFYKKYPTIYHLRNTLTKAAPDDIRELFLAIHHIMKYRGNFLYEGEEFKTDGNLQESLKELLINLELWCADNETALPELENIILDKFSAKSDKAKRFAKCFDAVIKKRIEAKDSKDQTEVKRLKKQMEAIGKLLVGLKANADEIFSVEEFKELEEGRVIEFGKGDYTEEHDKFEAALGDRIGVIDIAKTIYDTIVLSKIKKAGMTLSESKISDFEKHNGELVELKALLKTHRSLYNEVFKADQDKLNNYVRYIKKANSGKSGCSREEFYKYLKSILEQLPDSDSKNKILKEIELEAYLPLLRVTDNGVIPYQMHLEELRLILDKAKSKFTFLGNVADGLTVADKILALFTFRIPYYVGPLIQHIGQGKMDFLGL